MEVRLDATFDTVWLTQQQITELFGVQKATISKHMKNIFSSCELTRERVLSKMETTASDGKKYQVDYYNLDMILSVGYRVNSVNATRFRQWANSVLRDYVLNGYSINRQLIALQERTDERFMDIQQQLSKTSAISVFLLHCGMRYNIFYSVVLMTSSKASGLQTFGRRLVTFAITKRSLVAKKNEVP